MLSFSYSVSFFVSLPELQMGSFNNRLILGLRRTVCIVTDGGGIVAVVANSFK